MSQPYVGEIRLFGGNFAPAGWAFCAGQLLPISENETLFQLIGTTYGGDGQSTFGLPDLRGRVPIHTGSGFVLAETGGVEEVTLTSTQMPVHSHTCVATSSVASDANPGGNVLAQATTFDAYQSTPGALAMAAQSVASVGGNQPHSNMQPFLCVSFIISLFGIFPSPT
ncbi:MAG: tail fiber protein [Dokdonella sp.]|nr:phage tail protein [Xanthomonadales bacterium]MCB1575853.1 phage tail protein [Xanthomonadales bacterium]